MFQGPCVTIHLNMTRNIGKRIGEYLFPKGSTYILGQKYWGSTFKLGNKNWVSIFSQGVLLGRYAGYQNVFQM